VLGAVRARHNDLVKIEKSIIELLDLLDILNQQVVQQGAVVEQIAEQAEKTTGHLNKANVEIEQGVRSARRARKLKWWCLGVVVLICIVIALGVGIGVSMANKNNNNNQ
jgi:syntaxin 1B/2/3